MTFNVISFSLGFMSQHAEAARENPALRATMPAQETTQVLEASSEQRRMLDLDGIQKHFDKWYGYNGNLFDFPSACYDNKGHPLGTLIGRMRIGECEKECRKKGAKACQFDDDNYDGVGECSYVMSSGAHDCRYVNLADWDFEYPCYWWDGWTISCKVFSMVVSKGADVFVGCFKDNTGGKRDLSKYIGKGKNYKTCARICKRQGYKYFGRQELNHCFCGNSYGSQGTATTCDCDNRSNVGGSVNCVYKTK
jgi:hypothetical protein